MNAPKAGKILDIRKNLDSNFKIKVSDPCFNLVSETWLGTCPGLYNHCSKIIDLESKIEILDPRFQSFPKISNIESKIWKYGLMMLIMK
eukprot:g44576.t1